MSDETVVESVAQKTGIDPEIVRIVLDTASSPEGSGSSHKVEIPVGKVIPSSNVTA